MTVDNTLGYSIAYFAEKNNFDTYLPLANTTMNSFKILGVSSEPVEIEEISISKYLTYEDPENGFIIKYPSIS